MIQTKKDGAFVKKNVIKSHRLHISVSTVVHCFVVKRKQGGRQQKSTTNTCEIMVKTIVKQRIADVIQIVTNWSWNKLTSQRNELRSGIDAGNHEDR